MDNYKAHIYINKLSNRVWHPDYNKGIFFIEDWIISDKLKNTLESNNIKYEIIEEFEHHTKTSIFVNISDVKSSMRDNTIDKILTNE